MSELYYSTDGGLTVCQVGEVKEIFISEPTQEVEYPEISLQGETITMSLDLCRKGKIVFGRIFEMPKYKITEWMFPKKKKRGSKRRNKRKAEMN